MMTAALAIKITSGAERDLAGIWQRRVAQRGPDGDDGADALLDDLVASIESFPTILRKDRFHRNLRLSGSPNSGNCRALPSASSTDISPSQHPVR